MVHVDYLMIATILEGDLRMSRSIIRFGHLRANNSNGKVILTVGLSVCICECMCASKRMRGCLPACLSVTRVGGGGGRGTLFIFINLSECPHPLGWSVFLSFYLFVSTGIPCSGLQQQTFFPLCLKYDLFRKTILTNLNMLSVDHVFCER